MNWFFRETHPSTANYSLADLRKGLLAAFFSPYLLFYRNVTADYKRGARPASDVHFRIVTRVFDAATNQPIPDAVLQISIFDPPPATKVAAGYSQADGTAEVEFSDTKTRENAEALNIRSMYLWVLKNGYQPVSIRLTDVQNRMNGIGMRKLVPTGKNVTAVA